MKDYLIEFFKKCEYEKEDADYLLTAYDKISESTEARDVWLKALSLYDADVDCDFKALLEMAREAAEIVSIHPYTAELLLLCSMSRRLEKEYEKRGLSADMYYGGILDLRYKLEECKLIKGIVGIFVGFWLDRLFNVSRFMLGRLQFQIINFGHTYEKNGIKLNPESKVIDVHIARTGTPLDEESCDKSFALACEFFKGQTDIPTAFVCNSWLLYPEHEKMLSHNTNVYKFMSRFDIFRFGKDVGRENLWRLFDTDEKRWDKLPADSSFRRAYIEHLKNGGNVGWGHGIFIVNSEE
ncbi:MAG: hypothetical protein IIV81_03455 [Clostridia bacterium]|nr:hypothetical protein [Clostridia bacterium]